MKESERDLGDKSLGSRLIDYVAVFFKANYGVLRRIGHVFAGLMIILAVKPWVMSVDIHVRGSKLGMPVRWLLAGVGLFFIFFAILHKFPKKHHEEGLICPKCLTPYGIGRAPKLVNCSGCNIPLEPIDGFYDRHPELKDKKDEFPEDLMHDLK